MKSFFKLIWAFAIGAGLVGSARAADTAGTVSLNFQLYNAGGNYAPKHVVAVWLTNQSLGYIKCIWKDGSGWTGEGTTHLDKLKAARGSSTVLDGHSGATITTYTLCTATWNCSNAANTALAPDGTYYFHIETTDKNSAGPYSGSLPMLKGTNAFTTNYPDQTYIKSMSLTFTPVAPQHDITVTGISPTSFVPNTNATVTVTVSNRTTSAEAFSLSLSNATTTALIATKAIGSLAGNSVTNVSFTWSTTNLNGSYTLRAKAGPVTGETSTNDNTFSAAVQVQAIPHDLAVTGITPAIAEPNSVTTLYVAVTNKTITTESFSVSLTNLTSGLLIGSRSIASLAGSAGTNVSFSWNTTSLLGTQFLKAVAGPVSGEGSTNDNAITNIVNVRPFHHDVGIASFVAPSLVWPNSSSNLTLVVTNSGEATETFNVQIFDDTAGRVIQTPLQISGLAIASSANLNVTWTATNSAYGPHILRAVASPVAAETDLADNTNTVKAIVANGLTNITLISKGSAWRFHDQGIDLTATPWRLTDYPDSAWGLGAAPLGYGAVAAATSLSWGPDATNKYPASYFRRDFYADAIPSSLSLKVRRADGVVLHLNGVEIARLNMPAGALAYTNLASSTAVGIGLTTYYSANVTPTNIVIGKNTLAAEVHRASLSGSNLVFDLEAVATVPGIPDSHLVDASGLSPTDGGIVGDQVPILVTVTNRGNRTETVQVLLRNNLTGQIVGSQIITGVGPSSAANAQFDWATLGAAGGANILSAYTVVAGVTNFVGAFTNTLTLGGTGFATNSVNVTGAIGGRCSAVAASGNVLLVGAGATLEVWDASNPTALAKLGQVRLPGLIEGIAVKGSSAFVACGSAGVQFLDLASPASPKYRLTFDTSGHAYGLAVSGNLLFVADGVSGLRILDISSPSAPTLSGAYYTEGPARGVAVDGTRVFLVDAHKGLLILDASTPAAPALLGAYAFHAGQAVAMAGSLACVVDANNHFFDINVSTPSAPTLAGSLLVPNLVGQAVLLNGSTAYVSAGELGLQVVSIASPSAPMLVRSLPAPTAGQTVQATLAGANLFVANGFAGFQVLDATATDNPTLRSDWPTAVRACQVAVNDSLACLAAGENGLRIFNVANPAAPTWIGLLTNALNARCVAMANGLLVIGDGQFGVKVASLANPSSPVLLGSWSGTNLVSLRNIGLAGSRSVASDGRTLALFDLSTPASPALVATYAAPAFVFDMAISGDRAYLACGNSGLIVLEIGPASLAQVGAYVGPGLATSVSVSGTRAFLANGPGGWSILDISGPTPTLVKSSLTEGPVTDIAAVGVLATLGNGLNLATGLNVSSPLTPVPVASFNSLVRALHLTASGSLVFAAEDDAGVAIDTVGFRAYLLPSAGGSAQTIQWNSVAGGTYTIHKSTDLRAGFTVLQDNVAATPPLNSFTDTAPGEAAYYIISVR